MKMCKLALTMIPLLWVASAVAGEAPMARNFGPQQQPPYAVQERAAYQTSNTVNCTVDRFGNVRLTSEVMQDQMNNTVNHGPYNNTK